jgi:serine/threonine protein kinase
MSAAPAKSAAPTTVDAYWKAMRQSQLLTEEVLAEWQQLPGLPDDPARIAQMMVKANVITSFQAKQLMQGRYRGFFLGSYKILDQIGAGGMGTVFVAEHTTLMRKVALKVLPVDKARDKVALERFYREARSAAALNHQHIVKLHDISQGAGVHFLVMEFVDGITLQELIDKTGPMHYAQAVQIISQVALGLQHAHDKGFVHRDIKPANIIQEKNGGVKILDMGLARSFDKEEDNLTGQIDADCVMGTVDYIAPEQALRNPADHRSDIYSLGATFFNLITGTTPFQGTTAQKLMGHQLTEVPKLHKLRGSVPPDLNQIVAKMMAKNPKDRYQSCSELVDALARYIPSENQNSVVESGRILESDTRRSDRQTKLATKKTQLKKKKKAAKEKKRKLILAGIGSGIALMVVLLAWMLWPESKPTTVAKKNLIPDNNQTQNASTRKPNLSTILDARLGEEVQGKKQFGTAVQQFQHRNANWFMNSWREGERGQLQWIERGGKKAVELSNIKGNSCQLFTERLSMRGAPGQTVHIRIEYQTGKNSIPSFILRRNNDTSKEDRIRLSVQEGWQVAEEQLNVKEDCDLYFYLQNTGFEENNELVISSVVISVSQPGSSSTSSNSARSSTPRSGNYEVVFASNFGSMTPFRTVKLGKQATEGTPSEIESFWYQCYNQNTRGEFVIQKIQGVTVYGMRHLEGDPACQLGSFLGEQLRTLGHGAKVQVLIEYMIEGDGEAVAQFQQNGRNYSQLAHVLLTPTSTWRTVELEYQLDESEPCSFVINLRKSDWVYIKSITLKAMK